MKNREKLRRKDILNKASKIALGASGAIIGGTATGVVGAEALSDPLYVDLDLPYDVSNAAGFTLASAPGAIIGGGLGLLLAKKLRQGDSFKDKKDMSEHLRYKTDFDSLESRFDPKKSRKGLDKRILKAGALGGGLLGMYAGGLIGALEGSPDSIPLGSSVGIPVGVLTGLGMAGISNVVDRRRERKLIKNFRSQAKSGAGAQDIMVPYDTKAASAWYPGAASQDRIKQLKQYAYDTKDMSESLIKPHRFLHYVGPYQEETITKYGPTNEEAEIVDNWRKARSFEQGFKENESGLIKASENESGLKSAEEFGKEYANKIHYSKLADDVKKAGEQSLINARSQYTQGLEKVAERQKDWLDRFNHAKQGALAKQSEYIDKALGDSAHQLRSQALTDKYMATKEGQVIKNAQDLYNRRVNPQGFKDHISNAAHDLKLNAINKFHDLSGEMSKLTGLQGGAADIATAGTLGLIAAGSIFAGHKIAKALKNKKKAKA